MTFLPSGFRQEPGCPYCSSVDYRSVGIRNRLEGALLWLLAPCRCELCERHFFLFRWHAPAEYAPQPAPVPANSRDRRR